MSDTGAVSVVNAEEVNSVACVADKIAGFWVGQLLIYGAQYERLQHRSIRKNRRLLYAEVKAFIEGRLKSMMEYDTGGQWLINHTAEYYPPFMRALRASGILGASWPRHSSTSIVYRDGVFDVRNRVHSVERHQQYQIKSHDVG